MSILCHFGGHKAVPSNVWNDGYYFSRCSGCGCEMIGRGGRWHRVPRGYHVVWRRRSGEAINWTPTPVRPDAERLTDMIEVRH